MRSRMEEARMTQDRLEKRMINIMEVKVVREFY